MHCIKWLFLLLRAAGKDAIYGDKYDFDKSIKVIRRTDIDDKIVNGVVLERRRIRPRIT